MAGFLKELRRRQVYPVIVAYAVVAWLALQIGEVTFEPLGLPTWADALIRNARNYRHRNSG